MVFELGAIVAVLRVVCPLPAVAEGEGKQISLAFKKQSNWSRIKSMLGMS